MIIKEEFTMITREITGDLLKLALQGEFDTIIHGCNCFCSMGGGIAATIRSVFPEACQADLDTEYAAAAKLGTYSSAVSRGITIINAYTQYDCFGPRPVDYNAVEKVFIRLNHDLSPDSHIGIPLIGAGLAGGDWGTIEQIINTATPKLALTLVRYSSSD